MILEVVADMSQLQPLLHNAIMSNNDSFCDVRLEGSLLPLAADAVDMGRGSATLEGP